jgi:hypothetical protein
MMNNNLKITSDGTARGTKVFAGNTEIDGVVEIKLKTITVDSLVTVEITFVNVNLGTVPERNSEE